MKHGEPQLLFYDRSVNLILESYRQNSNRYPQTMDDDLVLNSPTEDLVAEITETYLLNVPVLDRLGAHVEQREGLIDFQDRFSRMGFGDSGGVRKIPGMIVELTIPFAGNRDFFFVRPATSDSSPPRAIVNQTSLLIRESGRVLSAEQVKADLNSEIEDIEKYLTWIRESTDPFNASLPDGIRNAVEARKAKLLKDRNMVASLGFNLKPRPGASKTFVAPILRKSIIAKPIPSATAPYKPEPVLGDDIYEQILTTMQHMTQVMELSPSSFIAIDEEGLRHHFLVQLNGQFQGGATGETFNFTGKTDIIIKVDGKNIFIAECKFWTGPKAFLETIDQLLGYLSWRDTKTAVLIFNRNKDFSAVLSSIEDTIGKHPDVKRGPTKTGETSFRAVFRNPGDHSREVILTVLAFDVPKKVGAP